MATNYRFGRFLLCPGRRTLWYESAVVEVGARAVDLLVPLVAAAGQPVSKQALMAAAWPGRLVEMNNLTVQMATLRRALAAASGESAGFIRTLPGKGYMFTRPVERAEPAAPPVAAAQAPAAAEPLSAFIGRATDLSEVAGLLAGKPLVTIVGIGGIGKTRLALQLGRTLADRYPDGVVFIDLAPVRDPAGVAEAVAVAVGAGGNARPATEALLAALRTRRTLLILDNAEHLRESVGALVQRVLERSPGVTALVTSRESLAIAGEQVFPLQPLSLPLGAADGPTGITGADALRYDAVRLFVDRAASLLPDFRLDDANAADIVAICQRLDGIALALEMAVPRLLVLSPRQLCERLQDRFRSVVAGPPLVSARQRTLRSMFDWSWQGLRPTERAVLERLAVFNGSAALGALTGLEDGDDTEWDVLDALTSLAQKSLLRPQPPPGETSEPRYRLLETTRQYVLEQLHPHRLAVLRQRHAEWVLGVVEQAEAEWPTLHGRQWLGRYGPEVENLRAALEWAFQCGGHAPGNAIGDDAIGIRLVAASGPLWRDLPSLPLRESRRWHALAVARITAETPVRIQAWLRLGLSWRDVRKGDEDNHADAAKAVALFRRTNDSLGLGAALWRAASTVLNDPARGQPLLHEAEQLLSRLPPTKWHALTLVRQADLAKHTGRRPEALRLYDEALAMVRAYGYDYGLMICGGNRAELLYDLGRAAEAIEDYRTLRRELPIGTRAPVVALMTWHLVLAGEAEEAADAIREIVVGFAVTGLRGALGRALEALALLCARAGDLEMAGRLLGCGQALHPPTQPRGPRYVAARQTTELVTAGMGEAKAAALLAEGSAWSEEDAVAAALTALEI